MNEALKTVEPVKFPANVTLVTKYFDKLGALMQTTSKLHCDCSVRLETPSRGAAFRLSMRDISG